MIKKIVTLVASAIIANAANFNIELKKDSWNLVGTPVDINISQLNLDGNDIVWSYKDTVWSVNKNQNTYNIIDSIDGQNGFWVYSTKDSNITLQSTQTVTNTINSGWSMFSPITDIIVENRFNNDNIKILWRYENNSWSAWDKQGLYTDANITKLETLNVGQGAWVYATSDFTPVLSTQTVSIGSDTVPISDGLFQTVTKSSSDNIEDIWNISFPVDTENLNDFKIGIKFIKESSGASGEIVFTGLNISNGTINNPSYIIIKGIKSDSTSGQTYFYDSYNPDEILSNSISLTNNILTLKLGTIMQKQTVTSEATFKAVSSYNLKINSDKLTIENGKTISIGNLTDFEFDGYFDDKNGIEGYIDIQ